jgi:hypothetical protein
MVLGVIKFSSCRHHLPLSRLQSQQQPVWPARESNYLYDRPIFGMVDHRLCTFCEDRTGFGKEGFPLASTMYSYIHEMLSLILKNKIS